MFMQGYLQTIGLKKFTIGKSPVPRFTRTSNNYSEHINALFRDLRLLPILHALYEIFTRVPQNHFEKSNRTYPPNRQAVDTWNERISKRTIISRGHTVRRNGRF